MPNTHFRDNPITVPSCKEHNNAHSLDDEYLLVCIASHWQNNPLAYEHTNTKVLRVLENSKPLWEQFLGKGENLLINRDSEQGVTAPLNKNRFDSEVEKIARGIYFHQFKQKSPKNLIVESPSLMATFKGHPVISELSRINELARGLLSVETKHGEHPDIFYYQFMQSSTPIEYQQPSGLLISTVQTSTIMRFVFYGGFEVNAWFK